MEDCKIVIVGAGVIGCATAFYLSQMIESSNRIVLVDIGSNDFASASGKACGFIASDRFDAPTAALEALSFRLHRELAEAYNGHQQWGYSLSTSMKMSVPDALAETVTRNFGCWPTSDQAQGNGLATGPRSIEACVPAWLAKNNTEDITVLSSGDTSAQIKPLHLCQFLLGESLRRGVNFYKPAKVTQVTPKTKGILNVDTSMHHQVHVSLKCHRMLIAAGAWSHGVFHSLFPQSPKSLPISRLGGHSLIVKTPRWTSEDEKHGCHGVFYKPRSGVAPEFFSRRSGEIYVAGFNDPSLHLPTLPTDAKPDDQKIAKKNAQNRTTTSGSNG